MSQDIKCLFGVHRYEVLEQQEVITTHIETPVGVNYVSRCANCGKLHITFVAKTENLLKFNI